MIVRSLIQFTVQSTLFMVVLAALNVVPAQAQPHVVCNIGAADETYQTVHHPQENPLKMNSVDTTHGFRFSGILLDTPSKFKSYVYYESKDRFVLISKQEAVLSEKQCGQKLWVDQSYSPYLENYLAHECEYRCAP